MSTTTVSGIVRDTSGTALPAIQAIVEARQPVIGFSGGAAIANRRVFTTDPNGLLTMSLLAGYYDITYAVPPSSVAQAPLVLKKGGLAVNGQPTQTLESAQMESVAITPTVVQQALAARDEAVNAAAQSVALQSSVLIRTLSGNHTLELADAGRLLRFTAAATLTIPPQSAVAWGAGATLAVARVGAGAGLIVQGGAGVTVEAVTGGVVIPRGGSAGLVRTAADEWLVVGDVA